MNSRDKGKRGERELANQLTELGYTSRRGVQYKGGSDSPDVVGLQGIHIECKRVEKLNIDTAMEQSMRDAGNDVPVVIHRRNRTPWKVTMLLTDFIEMYEVWNGHRRINGNAVCEQDAQGSGSSEDRRR